MTPRPESHASVSKCAGCGAETTALDAWVRLHDILLRSDCRAVIAPNTAWAKESLTGTEREWVRLWRQAYDALAGAA